MSEIDMLPLVVMCAPNGARLGKSDHASVPLTPAELADCAEQLLACGVSVLHLHVRDKLGRHTLDVQAYSEAMTAIRERVGDELILQVTTEAVGAYGRQQQMALVRELRPEAVSLALRELCPDQDSIAECEPVFPLHPGGWRLATIHPVFSGRSRALRCVAARRCVW